MKKIILTLAMSTALFAACNCGNHEATHDTIYVHDTVVVERERDVLSEAAMLSTDSIQRPKGDLDFPSMSDIITDFHPLQ